MDTRLTRHEIVEALTKERIHFPPTATVAQLRTIYGQVQEACEMPGLKDEPTQNTAAKALPSIGSLTIEPSAVMKTAVEEPAVIRSDETPADLGHISEAQPDKIMPSVHNAANKTNTVQQETEVNAATSFNFENLMLKANVEPESAESLEAELKALHLRLNILRAQEEIRTIESGGNKLMIGQRPHVDLNEIDAVIPPFSGEDHYDIVKWFNQFEDYAEMCGYGEKEKCLGLRRRLTGAAKNYVSNLGAVVSFDILKSPREDDRGVPVIGDKHRILNLPFGDVDNFECGDIGYLDMDDIGAITLDKGQLGVMGKDFAGDLPEGFGSELGKIIDIDPSLGRWGTEIIEVTDVENCQVTQMLYKGIVDSTRLRKWLEPTGDVDDCELDSEGNIDKYTDYEYLEDED
ncbi:hypothetical protein CVS40_10486 [Lucilia cuprina]|nr:hypothetical protein CVS40_10486 [Lucilia cuprina]